eukprot:800050-Rhodomonas_salina.3
MTRQKDRVTVPVRATPGIRQAPAPTSQRGTNCGKSRLQTAPARQSERSKTCLPVKDLLVCERHHHHSSINAMTTGSSRHHGIAQSLSTQMGMLGPERKTCQPAAGETATLDPAP